MGKNILRYQEKVLKILSGKMGEFYLVGGTALSLFYFHHRESLDLDFFVRDFSSAAVKKIIGLVSDKLSKEAKLVNQRLGAKTAKVMVYTLPVSRNEVLKIDFVEDAFGLIKPLKVVNGINVLSLEDIYLKKIQAAAGILPVADVTGRLSFRGGRQESKDFYDLYCLSSIFMPLSDFSFKYGNQLMREAIVRWYRTYNRFEMKAGILELEIHKKVDCADIERHFKKEIEAILEKEVASI